MKIVFMGTPEFAAASLEALIGAGHEIVLVVTQPDRQKGRGKSVQFSPVKECAIKHNIPVFTPERIKAPEAVEELRKYEADIFVVAAFGQILSSEILNMPPLGCINVHASLLPKYRGAAPIQWAIIDGEEVSGVTIMQMNEGLDTGDMLSSVTVPISKDETGDSLHDKLMEKGAELLLDTLVKIKNGEITATPQDNSKSCYAKMLNKKMGCLDFSQDAEALERLIRGLNSWPSAYTYFGGKTLKIWEAKVVEGALLKQQGEVFNVTKDSFCIAAGKGALLVESLQLEGKKRMAAAEFLRGCKISEGEILPS